MKANFDKRESPTILVVDDHPDQLRAAIRVLQKAGYRTAQASSGREALEVMRQVRPDLILLDVVLPDFDGREVLRLIRSDVRFEDTPVILTTALMKSDSNLREGFEAGADDYIARPLSDELLVARVKAQLRQRELTERLRTQEARLKTLIQAQADGVLVIDREGVIRFANPAAAELLGKPPHELPGLNFGFPLVDGAPAPMEINRPDGETRQVEMRVTSVEWEGAGAWLANLRDVTERHKTEEENLRLTRNLRERVRELRALRETAELLREPGESGDALLGKIAVVLAAGMQFPELAEARICHGPVKAATPRFDETMTHKLETGFTTSDGTAGRTVLGYRETPPTVGLVFFPEEEEMIGAVANMLRSHLDRVLSENALRQSEALLSVASRCGKLGGWTVDQPGFQHSWTDEAREIHGYEPGGKPTLEELIAHYDGEYRDRFRKDYERCASEGLSFDNEYRFRNTRGDLMWVRVIAEAVRDSDGTVRSVRGAIQDITKAREDREQLHLLANATAGLNDIVIITKAAPLDEPGPEIVFVNEAFERLTGYAPEEVLGKTPRILQGPESDRKTLKRISFSLREGRSVREELLNYAKDGRAYWLDISIQPVLDAAGAITHFVAVERDVTSEKEARNRLHESEERYRLLSKAISEAIWDWDVVNNRLKWSEGFRSLFGFARMIVEQPTFDDWAGAIHPEDRERVLADVREYLDSEKGTGNFSHQYRFRRSDGTYAQVRDQGHFIRDADGRIIRGVGGLTDVTEQHEAEERRRLLSAALDASADPVVITKRDGLIEWVNAAFVNNTGYPAEEALGKTPGELMKSGKHDDAFYREMWDAISNGKVWSAEMTNRHKDGSLHPEHVTITPVRESGSGEIRHFVAIKRDLTVEKRNEELFLRAQRMESIGTLAGGIAHDLNNLLSPILMGADLLKTFPMEEKAMDLLNEIERSAKRGAGLVKQVLTFARGTSGERVEIPFKQLLDNLASLVTNTFPKDIRLEVRIGKGLIPVTGDPTQIDQVLVNLAVNARDAMPEGGVLSVTVQNVHLNPEAVAGHPEVRPGDFLLIEVADTGTGMTSETKAKVFDPFFTTKEQGKGTGLGLSTTMGIIRSHGGFIHLYSEPRKGTVFKLYLPAASSESAPPVVSPGDVAESESLRGEGELILLVDDERPILTLSKRTLENFGYRVLTAADGSEAVAVFLAHRDACHLVVTDMMMPEMDGLSLARVLHKIQPELPIIAVSGLDANGKIAKARDAGVRHFLPKPFSSEALLRTVRQVLNAGKTLR